MFGSMGGGLDSDEVSGDHGCLPFAPPPPPPTSGEILCINIINIILQQKLYRLKSQPIFFKVSQTEWREPFVSPAGISGFSM